MRFLLIATVKNEGAAILEWVAHHKRIGFTDIVVYQNDSTDDTQKSLRRLASIGEIQYFDNSKPANRWQRRAYRRASLLPVFQEVDYAITIDGDEFLHINTPEGTLPSLIEAVGEKDEIKLNWKVFGSGGHRTLSPEMVTRRYSRAEDPELIATYLAGIKTLFKTDKFLRPGLHVPKEPYQEDWSITNGSGLAPDAFDIQGWRCNDPGKRRFAQVNHYMIRDAASFVLKSARGSTGHSNREVRLQYWRRADRNHSQDLSLVSQADDLWDRMGEMDQRTSGRLFQLRERAYQRHCEEFERQMQNEWAQELYKQIEERSAPIPA